MKENNIIKTIEIENFVLLIYFFIVGLSIIANIFELNYYTYFNQSDKDKYRKLNIFIFSVALIIYLYYFYKNYKSFTSLNTNNQKKTFFNKLNLIASGSITLAGIILLYIAINDTELDTEIFFT